MEKIKIGIIIILAIGLGTLLVWIIVLQKQNGNLSLKNSTLTNKLYACEHTPVKITIVRIPVVVAGGEVEHPKSVSDNEKDTLFQKPIPADSNCPCPKEQSYSHTSKIGDSIFAKWHSRTLGEMLWFKLDSVGYPKTIITLEKTVPCTPDTNAIRKGYVKLKYFKWGVYAGFWGKDFKVMPNIQAGLNFMWKNNWGLQPGALYQWDTKQLYWSANVILNF